MTLGQAITILAEEKNITKYRIAKNAEIPQATLCEIANGKNVNPTIDTIKKIAEGIGISTSDLIKKAEDLEDQDRSEN